MSFTIDDKDFKNIFDTIYEISVFINVADAGSLDVDDIEPLFQKSSYLERLIFGLKGKGFGSIFEAQLDKYLNTKDKVFTVKIEQLEKISDDVLTKILTMKPPVVVLAKSIEEYLKNLSYIRFENVILQLAEFHSLFVRMSYVTENVIDQSEVASSFLIQSWLKFIDCGEEGKNCVKSIMHELFSDSSNCQTVIGILCLESSLRECEIIQNMLLDVILSKVKSSPGSPSWRIIFESPDLVKIVHRFPRLLETIFLTLEFMETKFNFVEDSKTWQVCSSGEMDYSCLLNIVKSLYRLPKVHFKIKKFIIVRKAMRSKEFWESIYSDINNSMRTTM